MIIACRCRISRVAPVTVALICACAPVPTVETPTTDELGRLISNLLLRPEITCEVLRATFAVEYLPIVETPDQAGMAYEEHWVSTEDGELLRTWYLPTRLDRGTVVFSLGASGSMPCYLFITRLLVHNGWSVVMYEYRGFGVSSGEPNINALHTDLAAVLDWTIKYTGRESVTLLGVSLGTLPSVAVAVDRPDIVNGIVLDSPASMGLEVARFARALGHHRPVAGVAASGRAGFGAATAAAGFPERAGLDHAALVGSAHIRACGRPQGAGDVHRSWPRRWPLSRYRHVYVSSRAVFVASMAATRSADGRVRRMSPVEP
jgi:pimeloyl-ACP methyl ester carboxylesterase